MKSYRAITLFFLMTLVVAVAFRIPQLDTSAPNIMQDIEACKKVLPRADYFKRNQGPFPYYKAYQKDSNSKKDTLVGIAFLTTDFAPEELGYSGPIKIMVGANLEGTITDIHIISHTETSSHMANLDKFLLQLRSRSLKDGFVVGENVDAITSATVTSKAIARSVEKSLKRVPDQIIKNKEFTDTKTIPIPIANIIIPIFLFIIAVLGAVSYKNILRWIALCGGFIYLGIFSGTMISAVYIVNLILLKFPAFRHEQLWYMLIGLAFISGPLWGMIYCGSICPFAFVQEVLFNLRKKFIHYEIIPSSVVENRARYVKYAILWIIIMISLITGNANTATIEPFLTMFTFKATTLGWILLVIVLILALFNFRFWCKYLCPTGAFFSLISRKNIFRIHIEKKCINCHECKDICPVDALSINDCNIPIIDYAKCIRCGKCIRKCPQKNK